MMSITFHPNQKGWVIELSSQGERIEYFREETPEGTILTTTDKESAAIVQMPVAMRIASAWNDQQSRLAAN